MAALLYRLAKNHPFVDGNKRTAFVAAVVVLRKNGLQLVASHTEVVTFMENVAGGRMGIDRIRLWLQQHIG